MHPRIERHALKLSELSPWFVAALAVLSANWAADAIAQTFEVWLRGNGAEFSPLRAGYIAFFVAMVMLLYRKRKAFFRPHTRYLSNDPAEKRKHLILFLSRLADDVAAAGGVPEPLRLSDDIDADLALIGSLKTGSQPLRWTWEMPLRAIRHHLDGETGGRPGPLESVSIICSTQSISQVSLFLSICRRYRLFKEVKFHLLAERNGRTVHFCPSPTGWDDALEGYNFESFDQLSHALWVLLNKLKKDGAGEDEIMIDITGGQKPTSIVGASLTFNREIKAQYVKTDEPWRVVSYDIILAFSDTGRLDL